MKGRSFLLATLITAAALGGCTRPGTGKPYPLDIRSELATAEATALVTALKGEAYGQRRYRPVKASDGGRAIVMTVRSVSGPVEPGGRPGFTYLINWTRGGAEIGAVEADCVTGYYPACANIAVETMTRQLWPRRN